MSESRFSIWTCYTCHRKLIKNRIPAEASLNNLSLPEIPEELKRLNTLEQHLIARNIAFMKIVNLSKCGQNGVIEPCICVPANVSECVQSLPRIEEYKLIRIKLKHKLLYKGYYEYKFVNKAHVEEALHYLKMNNKWYNYIVITQDWVNPVHVPACSKYRLYILYAQYLSEIEPVLSCVSIALWKGSVQSQDGHKLTASMLNNKEKLKNMLKYDSGYKFLKPVRGTAAFWQSTQKDVYLMIRQLGLPTWFCSFSAADMRWPEVINTILKQQGDPRTIVDLDWNEKCMILTK